MASVEPQIRELLNRNVIVRGGVMETLKDLLQILINYILNNCLNIDKTTFLTIVIGQITIYGILLTFYQFVASYQGNEKAATRYLGINITEYFVKKNISVFNKIVSRKLFGAVFVLEILYKPFLEIYGDMIPMQMISIMNFVWFLFVIFYFVIFVILFFQCTKSLLRIKLSSDAKTNGILIRDINKMFLKKTVKESINQNAVELLNEDLKYLIEAIKYDDNTNLQSKYNNLIYNIFTIYTERKADEISIIEKKGRILKNQVPWIYNANYEVHLLQGILNGKYFPIDEKNMKFIFSFHMDLLKLNFKRAELAGYQKVSCNKYEALSIKIEEKVFNVSEWKDITLKIYRSFNDEMKEYVVRFLQKDVKQNKNFYKIYCDECVYALIESEIGDIFDGGRQQKDFVKIFSQILKEKRVNDICSDIIIDKIISYNRFDAGEIISQLNKKNCTYLFSYIIMYYSIYKFRFEWEYININVLKTLWKCHNSMQDDAEEVMKRINKSNIGHRFVEEMYIKLMEYIEASVDGELLNKVNDDKMLDVFYIWVIKICVIDEENLMYSIYKDNFDIDIQITIVNELLKHGELMENKNILNWIHRMRYNTFMRQDCFPEKLNITLRSLLLTNINSMIVINYASEKCYFYPDCIGSYILIKLQELPVATQKQKSIKEVVRTAFIASDMSVDEYVNMLEKECDICKCKINYIQKETMKKYLLKTF